MSATESPVVLACGGEQLVGVLHLPACPVQAGVVIVVGGPQYRVGSHRQFLLLARSLAKADIACLRFDYRGMGDSDGVLRGFEYASEDIRTAIDHLMRAVPEVRRVVLWGLCDGATAASFYAQSDPRVAGLVLLNPWVRSQQGLAKSLLFHYYVARLTDWSAWRKLFRDFAALKTALRSFAGTARAAALTDNPSTTVASDGRAAAPALPGQSGSSAAGTALLPRMTKSLAAFRGQILLILAGADITANEFVEAERGDRRLRERLRTADVTRQVLPVADHTFSRAEWRDTVAQWTVTWLHAVWERERPANNCERKVTEE